MRVEHVLWEEPTWGGSEKGLLHYEYGFHGDTSSYEGYILGVFNHKTQSITVHGANFTPLHASWVQLKRVGILLDH